VPGAGDEAVYANATTVDDRPLDSKTFAYAAVLLLAALVLLPGLVTARARRRGGR